MSSPAAPGTAVTTYKAQVAALIAFLGPIATFVALEGEWDWRAFVGAVIAAVVAGLSTYSVPYLKTTKGGHGV